MKQYHVVAAVIKKGETYLCMQKGLTKFTYTSYKFEFPGGKVEAGETEQQALKRELKEEMELPVEIEKFLITTHHVYPDFEITLSAYLCRPQSPSFKLKEHIDYKWLKQDQLRSIDWTEADKDILNCLG